MSFSITSDKVLFFTPESGITSHFIGSLTLAHTLRQSGIQVMFTRCRGIFSRCPVMDSRLEAPEIKLGCQLESDTCRECLVSSENLLRQGNFEVVELGNYFDEALLRTVEDAISGAESTPFNFNYCRVPFGAITASDFVLLSKHHDFENLTTLHLKLWWSLIKSALISYNLAIKMFTELPIARLVTYQDYSILIAARLAALKFKIPVFSIYHSPVNIVDRTKLSITNSTVREQQIRQINSWPKWRELSIPKESFKIISTDLISRLKKGASFIYSPQKSIDQSFIDDLGLDPTKPIVVAFSSSLDEMMAAIGTESAMGITNRLQSQPFMESPELSQVTWLSALIDYFQDSNEIQLVIRIHPREGLDGRNNRVSSHLELLKSTLVVKSDNIKIVWPESKISSYDLAEIATVCLTSISTIGVEVARLGVPVLAAQRGVTFVGDDFIEWAEDRNSYFSLLRRLLNREVSLDQVLRAYRFFYLDRISINLDFSDLVDQNQVDVIKLQASPKALTLARSVIIELEDLSEIDYKNLLANQSEQAYLDEKVGLIKEIKFLIHFIMTGSIDETEYSITLINSKTELSCDFTVNDPLLKVNKRFIFEYQNNVTYLINDQSWVRFSPLVSRLSRLAADHIITL